MPQRRRNMILDGLRQFHQASLLTGPAGSQGKFSAPACQDNCVYPS
jgi:hypothetical protein